MYPSPRPLGPPPNYTLRRLLAVTVLVVLLWLVYLLARGVFGGDDDGGSSLQAGAETTTTSTTAPALEEPPPCEYRDEPAIYDRPDDWFRTLVDPVYALPEQYQPPDLVPASEANYSAEFQIRALMAEDLNAMRNGILSSGVPEVALIAAYRSVEQQADLFARREAELGFDQAAEGTARPAHSEHHLGTAIDVRPIGASDVDQSFGDTETGQWLAEHAYEYGFILSYPEGEESVTCYKYEPWHFRYVGRELAGRIHDSGLTLREYLWHWEVTGAEPGVSPSAMTSSTASTSSTAPEGE
ncbi:MAG: M15 family metallopeptidase [Acidimicrobiales bacterium]|nr:M15 family metallopeptidase [Acidimicrobiales bacterium]